MKVVKETETMISDKGAKSFLRIIIKHHWKTELAFKSLTSFVESFHRAWLTLI